MEFEGIFESRNLHVDQQPNASNAVPNPERPKSKNRTNPEQIPPNPG